MANSPSSKTAPKRMPATYFALVKKFPLVHLSSRDELAAAQEVIDRLLEQDLDAGAQHYLDALTDLIETYEDEHYPIPDASEVDMLRSLMDANGLTQPALAKQVGIAQSTLSTVVNGGRSLTKSQVVALAKFFGVSPTAFLPRS
jgi:HTH-type transcriptional regulator/antitoxin HigA